MAKIYIDAGHGGGDPGAVAYGRRECDDTLRMVSRIKSLLEAQGVTVLAPATADTVLANREKCDYFLSIHRDSFSDTSANGATIYVYSAASSDTIKKARKIYDAVIAASGFKAKGLKKGAANYTDYAVCRDTNMAASLIELGFITSEKDNEIYDKKFEDIAEAIARSLCSIVGVNYGVKKQSNDTSLPTIRKGSKGDTVRKLQARLNELGYNCGSVDGDFGEKTDAAVRRFQKAKCLVVDGIVGKNTWRALGVS